MTKHNISGQPSVEPDEQQINTYKEHIKKEFLKKFTIEKRQEGLTQENLNIKLEHLVNNYINKRKQQWQKRTM